MAKKKGKRTYHRPPAQKNAIQRPVRLSQCMIVKNEEKNIEKALTWAKDIAFEQIVVDTGSTDRTVEIAESMGAKIYHFEWINDFSAAKNYAIEQAKGDWIAFLDADEYFPDEDAKKLMILLRNVEKDPQLRKLKTAIRCPIVNVDDDGKPFLVVRQDRIFRNTTEIRYSGKIHETIMVEDTLLQAPEISIIHTGYKASVYAETGKATRNIDMLREELSRDPENADLSCYLADALHARDEGNDMAEAITLYTAAINSGLPMLKEIKQNAYNNLIVNIYNDAEKNNESYMLCRKAYEEFPENPDFCFYYGSKLYAKEDFNLSWEKLLECERLLDSKDAIEIAKYVISNPMMLFFQMTLTAEELGKMDEIIRYATLVLKEDKYQHMMIAPYIAAFNRPGFMTPASEIFALLSQLYDFNNTKDKLTVMQAAKNAGNVELVQIILNTLTHEELSWLTESQG